MFFTRIFNFFRGYLIIRLTGARPERLFNMCARRSVIIWDAVRVSDSVIHFKISIRGFKLLRHIAPKTGCRIHIIAKRGLPSILHRYRQRKWFVIGLLSFAAVMVSLNQFVWEIEVVGNERVQTAEIKEKLSECGLKKGAYRGSVDEKRLKNEMLVKCPSLAWLWADKDGSRVIVEVKEKPPEPVMFDPDEYCNIISKKDAIIEAMVVRRGVPCVKAGDTVLEGDMLISGAVESERGIEPRFVQADAEVYARVWYERSRAFSTIYVKKTETGRIEKKHKLRIFGLEIKL